MKVKILLTGLMLMFASLTVQADEQKTPSILSGIAGEVTALDAGDLTEIRGEYHETKGLARAACRNWYLGCGGRNPVGRSADYPGLWFAQKISCCTASGYRYSNY